MNLVFFLLALGAFAVSAWSELTGQPGAMDHLGQAILKSAEGAVPLALGLVGVMALFLGLMKVAEAGGMVNALARLLSPVLRRLFPEIPPDHPAMGAMVMNVASNVMGLGNAATPFGIRAMEHLESLNPRKGVASNAQVLFLAINTAGVTVLPTSIIALRATTGAADPAAVVAPTLFATLVSAFFAIMLAKMLSRIWPGRGEAHLPRSTPEAAPLAPILATVAGLAALVAVMVAFGRQIGPWIIPVLVVGLLGFGVARRVPVYETFVEGAKDGFAVAIRIIPYLVAILVAVGMFRASGAMELVLAPLGHLTAPLGIPAEALTMAGMRTLSGSGSFGLLADYMRDPAVGPDGFLGVLLGTIYGSSETTFYVIAVYFGAIGTRHLRHALAVGLLADLIALMAAAAICAALYF